MGSSAMADNVSGSGNVAIGDSAGAGVEGDFNIYLGAFAGPSAPGPESETIRIGDVFNSLLYRWHQGSNRQRWRGCFRRC